MMCDLLYERIRSGDLGSLPNESTMAPTALESKMMLSWEIMTPLGSPVVPDV